MRHDTLRIIRYLKSIPFVQTKRFFILSFLLSTFFLIVMQILDKAILLWAVLIGITSCKTNWKKLIDACILNPINLRKSILLIILYLAYFSLTDSDWKNINWLKSYLDWGTLMFVLLVFTTFVTKMNKNITTSIMLVSLTLIPMFVIIQLPILADTYAVFAFLLVTYLVIKEIVEVRHIQVEHAKK